LKPGPWPTHQDYLFIVSLITESLTRIKLLAILKFQCCKSRPRQKVGEGPEKIVSAKVGKSRQKIGKPRQTLKNTKYIHFFQNFKHIKQQQHQINTLAHKYGEITDIYVVTSGCQIKSYTSK
jgi:hypothetical protein